MALYLHPNVSTYIDILLYANYVTNGLFAPGAIVTMFIITFISTVHFSPQKAFIFASWIGMLTSVMFLVMNLLDERLAYIFIILMALPTLIESGGQYL